MKICKYCGYQGEEKKLTKGSFFIEVFMWGLALIFLIVWPLGVVILLIALIYSFWRFLSTPERVCPKCRHNCMIPLDTPAGKKLAEKYKTKPN